MREVGQPSSGSDVDAEYKLPPNKNSNKQGAMYTRILSVACIILVAMATVQIQQAFGAIMLFDNKVRVKGSLYEFMIYRTDLKREERQYRDTDWGLMRTKATLEVLYKAVENDKLIVNLFGFFHYWHESVPDFDGEYRRSIATRNHKKYQGPFFDQDDWINELYVDLYAGRWNLRLGKQIIFWSEVEMVRTIDRINTLDLRYTTPGIDPWDEMKLGLWMLRGFYNSNLPGQLVFEWIWIPGDFEQVRTPGDGTSMAGGIVQPEGPERLRPRAYGQKALADTLFDRARPAFTLRNSQFAFRIRGSSDVKMFGEYYLLDWTVSWYHGMNTSPVARNKTLGKPSVTNLNPRTLNGLLGRNAVSRVFGLPLPHVTHDSFFRYKFFDAIGASCQTYVPSIEGVIRGEVSYEIGLPVNKTFPKHIEESGQFITGTSERDQLNVGLTIDRPVRISWLQQRGWDIFDCSFGWYSQWRLGNVSRRWSTFGWRDRSQTNFTFMVKGRFYHAEFRPVVRFLYNTRNWGYGVVACRYMPGEHMRYELGYLWFYGRDPTDSNEASMENGDSIYFRIGYEF